MKVGIMKISEMIVSRFITMFRFCEMTVSKVLVRFVRIVE